MRVSNIVQIKHWNEGCTEPLIVPIIIEPNTPEATINDQIRQNSLLALPWLTTAPPHDGVAIICGGGPSLNDTLDEIREMDGSVFALNAASLRLHEAGIAVDYQIIIDAQEETSSLVDVEAMARLYSSTVHPHTAAYADLLFHMNFEDTAAHLPPERVAEGDYTFVGGGISVGITALCVAFTMGYRTFHLFGYDSSNRGVATHAYTQLQNAFMPCIDVEWGGQVYRASLPMKLQAEAFPNYARELMDQGVTLHVHGSGLLPAMWNREPVTEREKYQQLWGDIRYREWSPGETSADKFVEIVAPDGPVIDFGCGTGRGGLAIAEKTDQQVTLVDFVDNCRDKEALVLPFVQWDLTDHLPLSAPYGYCTDVLEHIPTEDVPTVIKNIMAAAERVFFQVCTIDDRFGAVIGQTLHLTVRPHDWWLERFSDYTVQWQEEDTSFSCFYIIRKDQ